MEKNRFKSLLSSRPAVGLLFTLSLALFLLIHHHAGTISISRRSKFLVCELVCLLPLVLWSIYEIFRLDEGRSQRFFSVILASLMALAPTIHYVVEMAITGKETNGYRYLSSLFLSLGLLYLFGTLLGGRPNILEGESYRRRYSFRRLLVLCSLFWNLLLYMCIAPNNIPALALILISTISADTLGFIVGRAIGRHRVFPSSPTKTLEGFLVPLLLVPLTLFLLLYYFGGDLLDTPLKTYLLLPSLLLMALSSSFGDLYFSEQKRLFGVKDYGGMMGSHGGFWDRFDSHTFGLLAGVPLYLLIFR